MKKHRIIALLCVATLLSGCGNAATPAKNDSHNIDKIVATQESDSKINASEQTKIIVSEQIDKKINKSEQEDESIINKINGSEDAKEMQKENNSKSQNDWNYFEKGLNIVNAADNAENFCLSPLSMDFALAIAANGANNDTRAEYENYFGESIDSYNAFILDYMENSDTLINNNLFVNANYALTQDYQNRVQEYLALTPENIVFNSDGQAYINSWISNNTNHLLNNSAPSLDNSMQAVLVNTIYFNKPWQTAFTSTRMDDFYKDANTIVDATYMNGTAEYYININEGEWTGFAKDYDERYQFIALVSDSYDISYSVDFNEVFENMYEVETDIAMPKFSFTTHSELNPVLDKLGFSKLLTGLDNIIENRPLYIDTLYQDCVITVDENGTEAAAATIGTLKTVSFVENPSVTLDKPFVFVIYDTAYDVPLFIGSVSNP